MIDEIARPEVIWHIISAFVLLFGGFLISIIIGVKHDQQTIALVIFIGYMIFVVLIVVSYSLIVNDWRESVQIQIESLSCEDLEEAYEIYELEYIRERYVRECTDDWEWWK